MQPETTKLGQMKAIFESELWQRFLANNSGDVIWLSDLELNYTYISPSAERLSGYSVKEILNLSAEDILTPSSMAKAIKIFGEELTLEEAGHADQSRSRILEVEQICKDGSTVWVELNISFVRDDSGKPIGLFGITRNIDARKKAEEALQANYTLLRIAGKTAKFGGWSVDLRSNICTWSDQVAEIHGMPAGYSPPVKEGISFYAPEWRAKITEAFTACAEEGIPYDEEMQIITAKGQRVWVRTIGEAVRDENGNITMVQGSFQDITEHKKTEQALYVSEERLDMAMAVKNEGMWDWNLLTNETYFDKRYYTMAGYKPDEFPHNFTGWAERVHQEDLPKAQQAIDAYLKGKSDQFDIEFRFKKKDGQWMWINGKGKIYGRDKSGSPLRMIGTHTDITDRKQAEAEIRRLNEELEQRVKERTTQLEAVNAELQSFAYSVSHDLRAPLRAMGGFSEILLAEYNTKLDDQGRHYLERIQAASNRMGDLINDLLKLSRVTRAEFKKQQVDLSKLAAEIFAALQEAEPQHKARLEIPPGLIVQGDASLLRAVMENLLGNAWKFSANEKEGRIEVGRTTIKGEEVFYIRDNGAGFDMTYADKLFVAFQRLHGAEEFPGTGIGLATVQRVINRHGGKVWAESEVDKGATFYFTLGRVKNER